MLRTTVGQLLIQAALPPDMRGPVSPLDKGGISKLLKEVADRHPEKYRDVSKALSDVGRDAAFTTGGNSFGLEDLRRSFKSLEAQARIERIVNQVLDASISEEEKSKKIVELLSTEHPALIKAVQEESRQQNNPLAEQLVGAGRGKPVNLAALRAFDALYLDPQGEPIALPVLRSYSQGLRPSEYFAGAYGARKGIADVQMSTAAAGYLAKQTNQMLHRLVVTETGDDDWNDEDAATRGLPTDVDDRDNEGALLARAAGGYRRNTILTPRILQHLKQQGIQDILVRSPIVGGPADGGVRARDLGVRERGGLAPKGDFVGLAAAQSISEGITQASLCLAKGTLVRMADGSTKAIELIMPGDWVLGADTGRMTFPVQVLNLFNNGLRDCVHTTFSGAYSTESVSIISTADHKILCSRCVSGQKDELSNYVPRLLPIGTKSKRFFAHLPIGTQNRSCWRREPFAKLLGLLSGDGCYTASVHGVYLSCYDPQLIIDTAPYLATLNLKTTKLKGHKGYYRLSQIEQAMTPQDEATGKFSGSWRNPACCCLESRGMFYKYAHEKELPPDIEYWDNESVLDYFAGLFATAGSWYMSENRRGVGAMYFALGMTALPIVAGVKRLLAERFGVYAGTIHKNDKDSAKRGGKRKNPIHRFVISQAGQVRQLTRLIIDRLVGIKRQTAEAALRFTACRYDEYRLIRRRQEFAGRLQTFDLEVNHPDHLFVLANGLIVSNSSKHSGGVASAGGIQSGFKFLNQQIQVPKIFPGGATHAQVDGRISAVKDAPQGGKYVIMGNHEHYVPAGVDVLVKPGDEIEAGDVLSAGVPNPSEIVKHKGIGEGRRYFTQMFRQAMRDAGPGAHRRNVELFARGLIDHVRLTEEIGDYVPDDVIPYNVLERAYAPRPTTQLLRPQQAVGQYLEKPVLHYSIGTKIRPSMITQFNKFGIQQLPVHKDPPPFEAHMIRGIDNISYDPDFMTRMLGSGQKASLLDAVHRGGSSDTAGTSYVPALAAGTPFGQQELTKGWVPRAQ